MMPGPIGSLSERRHPSGWAVPPQSESAVTIHRDFFDQPKVADAVSDLFRDVFGIQRTSVRVVIGVASLPLGVPIRLDVIFEVAE
jgi:hypothetical protein